MASRVAIPKASQPPPPRHNRGLTARRKAHLGLTPGEAQPYNDLVLRRKGRAKTYLSAQGEASRSRSWLSQADAPPWRADCVETTAFERPATANGIKEAGRWGCQEGMEKERRLRRAGEFLAVRRQGKQWSNPLLVMRALSNQRDNSRLGFVVSGRVGNAVVRNRVKRRLKEIARRESVQQGWDVVFIARTGIVQASFSELQAAMRDLLHRSRLLEYPPTGAAL